MVKMLSFQVEDALVNAIDDIVAMGFYSSRSEFLKDSVRKGIENHIALTESYKKVHFESERLRLEFKAKNKKIRNLSRKERATLANELLEKKSYA
jgi:Arc/MetJ-type ribon-helix-helix transcriptional regulator